MRPTAEWSPELLRRIALGVGLCREDGVSREEFRRRWRSLSNHQQVLLLRRFSGPEPVARPVLARALGWDLEFLQQLERQARRRLRFGPRAGIEIRTRATGARAARDHAAQPAQASKRPQPPPASGRLSLRNWEQLAIRDMLRSATGSGRDRRRSGWAGDAPPARAPAGNRSSTSARGRSR